jgi:hypothetical protein
MEFLINFIKYDISEDKLELLIEDQDARDRLFGDYLGEIYEAESEIALTREIEEATGYKVLILDCDQCEEV